MVIYEAFTDAHTQTVRDVYKLLENMISKLLVVFGPITHMYSILSRNF